MQLQEEDAGLHHTEFWPLVNPRTHVFAGGTAMVCAELKQHWTAFLQFCCRLKELGSEHMLQVRHSSQLIAC